MLPEEQYEVLRPIGHGSFGQVFLVLHKKEHRHYVMKSIELQTSSPDAREATESEVKLLSSMRHPNIVAYRDSFVDQAGSLCILMEYCEHGDIYTYLQEARRSRTAPEEGRLLEWFIQITLALHALHHKNILHRDLKTQNIFLTGCKVQSLFALKLGDFGIAKMLDSTDGLAKTQIGTPFYMSPELINNKAYGVKSDIWGLGCVLYEIINAQRAFDAQSLNGLALKIIKGHYTPITSNCSQGTKSLIKSMLSKSPTHRPTLREILHTAALRQRVPLAQRSVIAATPPESRAFAEQVLTEQLASLGVGAPGASPLRDRKKLAQRLRRVELRKQREEEVLQHTVALLEKCLEDQGLHYDEAMSPRGSRFSLHSLSSPRTNGERRSWASGAAEHAMAEVPPPIEPAPPALSHRERSVRTKDRRKEDGHPRMEDEARRPRDELAAHPLHRSRVSDRRLPDATAYSHGGHHERTALRGRARTEEELPTPHATSVSWLLDYQHIQPANLAHPFESCRPNVVHSPRSTVDHRRSNPRRHEPSPPPLQYGEPLPPASRPQPGGWRAGDMGHGPAAPGVTAPARPPLRSVYLEALSARAAAGAAGGGGGGWHPVEFSQGRIVVAGPPPAPQGAGSAATAPQSEDSMSSGSLTEVQELEEWEGLSDASGGGWPGGDEHARQQRRQALLQRIDECKAAIHRHRMTIEMLEHSFVQEDPAAEMAHLGNLLLMEGANSCPPEDALRRPAAPVVIQDCAARLMRRCLEGLGADKFQAAMRCLQMSVDAAELPACVRERMVEVLGLDKIGFLSMLDQLAHIERAWGAQEIM